MFGNVQSLVRRRDGRRVHSASFDRQTTGLHAPTRHAHLCCCCVVIARRTQTATPSSTDTSPGGTDHPSRREASCSSFCRLHKGQEMGRPAFRSALSGGTHFYRSQSATARTVSSSSVLHHHCCGGYSSRLV